MSIKPIIFNSFSNQTLTPVLYNIVFWNNFEFILEFSLKEEKYFRVNTLEFEIIHKLINYSGIRIDKYTK